MVNDMYGIHIYVNDLCEQFNLTYEVNDYRVALWLVGYKNVWYYHNEEWEYNLF